MTLPREAESVLRQILELLPIIKGAEVDAALSRLEQLQRGLEPENEFAMVLAWLGKCQLVHKLGQEQLPLNSTDTYRVPDLFVVFDYNGLLVPALVEVKKTTPADISQMMTESLSLKPHYLRYAELLGLPMLVAWKNHDFWTLFEMKHAQLADVNYKIEFGHAFKENLLGVLAGDFSYRLAPRTRLRLRFTKLSEINTHTGGFEARIDDPHFVNPQGQRIPDIPHLSSLFMFWDNDAEQVDEGDAVIQDFVVPDVTTAEFASRTLPNIVNAFSSLRSQKAVQWRSLIHDAKHFAHNSGQLRELVDAGEEWDVITDVINFRPQTWPAFLPSRT